MNENESENTVDADDFVRRIELKAYELYAKRGFVSGHEWDDWFEAEKAIKALISDVDKDCIRSEILYKSSHKVDPLPSYMDIQKTNDN